jgi:hypothetical protein
MHNCTGKALSGNVNAEKCFVCAELEGSGVWKVSINRHTFCSVISLRWIVWAWSRKVRAGTPTRDKSAGRTWATDQGARAEDWKLKYIGDKWSWSYRIPWIAPQKGVKWCLVFSIYLLSNLSYQVMALLSLSSWISIQNLLVCVMFIQFIYAGL